MYSDETLFAIRLALIKGGRDEQSAANAESLLLFNSALTLQP